MAQTETPVRAQTEPVTIGEVYLHVGNSGLTVQVVDEGFGPTFVVKSSSFGNLQTTVKTYTTRKGLRKIGLMLMEAADSPFSEDYVCAARLKDSEKVSENADA